MKNDDFQIPFGKHKGLLFREVSLEYLDWLIGWLEETESKRNPSNKMMDEFRALYRAAVDYLSDKNFGMDDTIL